MPLDKVLCQILRPMTIPNDHADAYFRSILAHRRRPYLIITILAFAAIAGTALYIVWGIHRDGTLDRTGTKTTAIVQKVMPSNGSGDDKIQLSFADRYRQKVVATAKVNEAGKYKTGDMVPIVYDAKHPHRVRTIGDAAPTWEDNLVIPVVAIPLILIIGLYGLVHFYLFHRVEQRMDPGALMSMTVKCVSRGRQKVAWAILTRQTFFDEGTDHLAVRVPFRFCTEQFQHKTPVTVKGDIRPRGRVVIHTPEGVILPLGKARPKEKARLDG